MLGHRYNNPRALATAMKTQRTPGGISPRQKATLFIPGRLTSEVWVKKKFRICYTLSYSILYNFHSLGLT